MKTAQLCSEVNGGSCKNKASARNGFVCAAGHSKSSVNGVTRPAVSISEMSLGDRKDLAKSTKDEATQWELFHTEYLNVQQCLAENPSISEAIQLELFRTGNSGVQWYLAANPSIDEALQLELFRTGNVNVQRWLAGNPSISEDLQWELFRTGNSGLQEWLAGNPSISEDLQWELFRVGGQRIQKRLVDNPSIGRELARELTRKGLVPFGYAQNKPLAGLVQPENLALLSQYPKAFGQAYLYRLLSHPQEDKEESKALTLYSYFVYEKGNSGYAKYYKNEILEKYEGDQEVALILGTEPA